MTDSTVTAPSPLLAGVTCQCPVCGKGKLFASFLEVAPACAACELDYGFADSGDGPAVFVIFVVAPIVVGLALILAAVVQPAPDVHLIIWLPAAVIFSLALLRPFKATLLALQYCHNVRGGGLL